MFKITREHTYRTNVTVKKPIDGGFEEAELEVEFKCMTHWRRDEIVAAGNGKVLQEALVKVHSPIGDAEGRPLTWSDDVRDQLLDIPYVSAALVKAYFATIQGAPAGN